MKEVWRSFQFKNKREREAFIVLSSVIGVGRKTLNKLILARIKVKVSFGQILGRTIPLVYKNYLNNNQINSIKKLVFECNVYSFISSLKNQQISVVTIFDDAYPKLLKESDDPPLVFYYRGKLDLLKSSNWIAMVGTRRMTAYGVQATRYLVAEFVNLGWGIVSGCMYGIDTESHQACMDAGGATLGVLGYGFGFKSSSSARQLEEKIIDKGGGLISEFPPGTPAQAGFFPLRNRIVAGLSQAVIVVEAAEKSGSHITAQCGLDAGRVVGAVPGPITSPYSQGTRALINQGAVCVSRASDVLIELGVSPGTELSSGSNTTNIPAGQFATTVQTQPNLPFSQNSLEFQIYGMLRTAPCNTQTIIDLTAKTFSEVMSSLTNLEVAGLVDCADTMWKVIL